MAMAPQGQEQEHEQPHGHRPVPTNSNMPGGAAAASTIATNRWGPYSAAGDFARYMAVILAVLPAGLALNAAVRYLLRCSRRARRQGGASATEADPDPDPEKAARPQPPPPPPALVYSAAVTKLAGAAAECAICLAEFVDGDTVRVMPACGHGFHARCIERWLAGGRRSSFPTCLAPLLPAAAAAAAAATAGAAAQQHAAAAAAASSSYVRTYVYICMYVCMYMYVCKALVSFFFSLCVKIDLSQQRREEIEVDG
ncbi:hypothetical protein SEVIR_1G005300v4 [Setaria viridis]|uniref:RING-type domain-containing protein n=1 Tax=Setaria viridis TaxID=4556 RepID=A0A4U6W7J7_SETVI|nr:RING-H2 finger protein ATL79-like [Setaria viridis]TKW36779.1 hypothetical protein SEVIR_1G005300v2 [Setaria viridis]